MNLDVLFVDDNIYYFYKDFDIIGTAPVHNKNLNSLISLHILLLIVFPLL